MSPRQQNGQLRRDAVREGNPVDAASDWCREQSDRIVLLTSR
jgi:hypothetical protein